MHNTLTRFQASFGFLTSCLSLLALLISTLSLLPNPLPHSLRPTPSSPSARISVRNIQVVRGRPHYYSSKREEYAHVRFDLDADLSALFDWNTKQVFVYVSAEYPAEPRRVDGSDGPEQGRGPSGGPLRMNKAVIWDTIIPAPASAWSFANVWARYFPAALKGGKTGRKHTAKSKSKSSTTARTKPGLLSLKNQKAKYQITDPSGVMSARSNATLSLGWNVQPWVGPLLWDRAMLEEKSGGSGAGRSWWNLPFLRHPWRADMSGRSERFDFPPIKGAQKAAEGVGKEAGGERGVTVEAAGVTGVV